MHKDFLNHLIKKSDLSKTDYFVYNKSKTKKDDTQKNKIIYNVIDKPYFTDYVVLDFETTGFSPIKDNILEIGAIKVLNNNIVGKFNTLINPKRPIPPYISEKIKITDNMVKDAPYIEDIFKDFYNFLTDLPLVIHNARFDMSFLITNGQNLGFNIKNSALDTVSVARKIFPELKKYNLAFLCNYFNIKNENAHRAMSDALATYQLYKILHNNFTTNSLNL